MPSRMLGWGLLGGGGAIALLMLVWLGVSGAHGGGIVLGLILMLFLAGPLVGAGAYVLSRQRAEAAEAAAFGVRRRVIDADRLFRAEVGASLRQLASSPALPGDRLRALADELQNPVHTGVEWQTTVQLNDNQVELLGRYDDLVRERVRRLRDAATSPEAALRELRQAIDQREDLLVRGRAAPTLQPAELMRTEAPRQVDLESIGVGDAISRERTNYVVESVAAYFAEGQSWKLARLAPTSDTDAPRWLYVGPAGVEVALLDEQSPPPAEPLPNTAVVDVTSHSGTARGILVNWSRGRDGNQLRLVERWPDNTSHAYSGSLLRSDDLDVWPAQASPPARNATLPSL